MRLFFIGILVCLLLPEVKCQRLPELPDVLGKTVIDSSKISLLKTRLKGISFKYSIGTPYRLEERQPNMLSGQVNNEEYLEFKYRLPLYLGDRLNILVGHKHEMQRFNLTNGLLNEASLIGQLNQRTLKGNRFTLYSSYRLNPNEKIGGAFSLAFNGTYDEFVNFNSQYRIFRGVITYTKAKDINNDWTFGIYYKNGFRSRTLLPFAVWNKTFNKKWGLQTILVTKAYVRYNYDDDNILLAGYSYVSDDFSSSLNLGEDEIVYNFKRPRINFSLRWAHRYLPILWTELEAGFQYNWQPTTDVNDVRVPENSLNVISHNMLFNFNIFLSPPDKWFMR